MTMTRPFVVVVNGPESTGKTSLTQYLAHQFNSPWIPEYARKYIEKLNEHYTYLDVEHIAKVQYQTALQYSDYTTSHLFVDTDLIITKIWFKYVYQKEPDWLADAILLSLPDMYLLCAPDIDWQPDPVRENGGEMRQKLFEEYLALVEFYGIPYFIITGTDQTRLENAKQCVTNFTNKKNNS